MDMAGACVPTSSVALCFPGERRKKASLLSNPLFLLSSASKRAFEIRSCASNFDQCGEEEEEGILFLPLLSFTAVSYKFPSTYFPSS